MQETPAAQIAFRLVRWLRGERRCYICHTQVHRSTAFARDSYWACSEEHADQISLHTAL